MTGCRYGRRMTFGFVNSVRARASRVPEHQRHGPAPSPFPYNHKPGDISTLSCFCLAFYSDRLTFRKEVPLCYLCLVETRPWHEAEMSRGNRILSSGQSHSSLFWAAKSNRGEGGSSTDPLLYTGLLGLCVCKLAGPYSENRFVTEGDEVRWCLSKTQASRNCVILQSK